MEVALPVPMTQPSKRTKPYDIRERVLEFVLDVNANYPARPSMNAPSARCWSQLFNAASSSGAHLEEADAASRHRHFTTLNRGALREMRESRYWLRIIARGRLAGSSGIRALGSESSELVAILTAIVKHATEKDESDTQSD
jgi:four helix bundle protein